MSDYEGFGAKKRAIFIPSDTELLNRLIAAHEHIINGKSSDSVSTDMKRKAWASIHYEYNRQQTGGIKTMESLRVKHKNEKKAKKQRMNENGQHDERFEGISIKIDEDEELQDSLFDENDTQETFNVKQEFLPCPSPNYFMESSPVKITSTSNNDLLELRKEGLRLDNKYKQLMIEKIQLEKVKLETEIQLMKMDIRKQMGKS